jgi:NADH:ubiquinone oxidoreductase subunit D
MITLDARLIGYEYYTSINFCIYFSFIGDCLDRYLLRLNEIIESCRIIYLLIYFILSSFRFIGFNSILINQDLMEVIINYFINFMLIRSLVQSLKLSIESNKGIYSIFISSFPFSCINIISNDFLVINEINNITKYINLADLITILGSIDFVLGSVDLVFY